LRFQSFFGGLEAQCTLFILRLNGKLVVDFLFVLIRPPDVSREGLTFYSWTFFFFFYQSTVLSSRAVDGHQMYLGSSAVGKALKIGIEISPVPLSSFLQEVKKY